jgi:uncharacterized membrane protein
MNIRSVAPAQGWQWITSAFALFRRNPLAWLLLNLALMLVGAVLSTIPLVGAYLLYLLTPVFLGGVAAAARDAQAGENVAIAHLVRGFREHASQLVTVGGVYLVGQVLISGLMLALGGAEFRQVIEAGVENMDPAKIPPELASRAMLALVAGMALFAPLAMAIWFAPALVMLEGRPGYAAMAESLRASLRNIGAFLIYGIASSALLFLALLPFGLGLVLWVPVMLITMYTSYRDVFAAETPPA